MACRGVLFAITSADAKRLLSAYQSEDGDKEVMAVIEDIEEQWDENWLHETDKAWDAIHRCLTDGQLKYDTGEYPLNCCILGGTLLYDGDDYIISLKSSEQVSSISDALKNIDEVMLQQRYAKIDAKTYDGEIGEEDFEYTFDWFRELPEFYVKAAKNGRSVVFTVDQ